MLEYVLSPAMKAMGKRGGEMKSLFFWPVGVLPALLLGCGERQTPPAGNASSDYELHSNITLAEALDYHQETETDILVEKSIRAIPAVEARIAEIRSRLAQEKRNNSVCVGTRSEIGPTGFLCNFYQYDIMFLGREANQSVPENLEYIQSISNEPLRSWLTRVIDAVENSDMNSLSQDCVQLAIRNRSTGLLDKDAPIIFLIADNYLESHGSSNDELVETCLR